MIGGEIEEEDLQRNGEGEREVGKIDKRMGEKEVEDC